MPLTNPLAFASEMNKGMKLAEATFSSLVKLAVCQQQQQHPAAAAAPCSRHSLLIKEVGAGLYE